MLARVRLHYSILPPRKCLPRTSAAATDCIGSAPQRKYSCGKVDFHSIMFVMPQPSSGFFRTSFKKTGFWRSLFNLGLIGHQGRSSGDVYCLRGEGCLVNGFKLLFSAACGMWIGKKSACTEILYQPYQPPERSYTSGRINSQTITSTLGEIARLLADDCAYLH